LRKCLKSKINDVFALGGSNPFLLGEGVLMWLVGGLGKMGLEKWRKFTSGMKIGRTTLPVLFFSKISENQLYIIMYVSLLY